MRRWGKPISSATTTARGLRSDADHGALLVRQTRVRVGHPLGPSRFVYGRRRSGAARQPSIVFQADRVRGGVSDAHVNRRGVLIAQAMRLRAKNGVPRRTRSTRFGAGPWFAPHRGDGRVIFAAGRNVENGCLPLGSARAVRRFREGPGERRACGPGGDVEANSGESRAFAVRAACRRGCTSGGSEATSIPAGQKGTGATVRARRADARGRGDLPEGLKSGIVARATGGRRNSGATSTLVTRSRGQGRDRPEQAQTTGGRHLRDRDVTRPTASCWPISPLVPQAASSPLTRRMRGGPSTPRSRGGKAVSLR